MNIKINEEKFDSDGWSILARLPGKRLHFSSWNTWIYDVYRFENYTDILLHQKDNLTQTDMTDPNSFNIIVDWLESSEIPELYFWDNRQSEISCFYDESDSGYSHAVLETSLITTYKDVNVIKRTPKGKFQAKV